MTRREKSACRRRRIRRRSGRGDIKRRRKSGIRTGGERAHGWFKRTRRKRKSGKKRRSGRRRIKRWGMS